MSSECKLGDCIATELLDRIGKMEARQEATEAWIKEIAADVRGLRDLAATSRGGFLVLMGIGGLFSAVGAQWVWKKLTGLE